MTIKINGKELEVRALEDIETDAKKVWEELKVTHSTNDNYQSEDMFRAVFLGALQAHYKMLVERIAY